MIEWFWVVGGFALMGPIAGCKQPTKVSFAALRAHQGTGVL